MKTVEDQRKILAENIQRLLDKKGKTQTDMARELNIAETTVSSWLKAKKYPRIDKIQMMADYFNVYRSDITEDKPDNLIPVSPMTVKVPILGTISCGDPIYASENFSGYRTESPDTLPSGNLFYLETKGKSMLKTLTQESFSLLEMSLRVTKYHESDLN